MNDARFILTRQLKCVQQGVAERRASLRRRPCGAEDTNLDRCRSFVAVKRRPRRLFVTFSRHGERFPGAALRLTLPRTFIQAFRGLAHRHAGSMGIPSTKATACPRCWRDNRETAEYRPPRQTVRERRRRACVTSDESPMISSAVVLNNVTRRQYVTKRLILAPCAKVGDGAGEGLEHERARNERATAEAVVRPCAQMRQLRSCNN